MADAQQAQQQQISVLGQYIRDFSFENPNAPQIFQAQNEQPQIDLGVNVQTSSMGEGQHEVVLMIKVEAKTADSVTFISELAYAGLFALPEMSDEQQKGFLLVDAPQLLFPFARNIIADAIRAGGFPQILINPIDFVALYHQQQAQMNAPTAGTA